MKTFITMSAVATCMFLTACASTQNNTLAMQKENNQFEVTGLGKTQVISKNNAISAANKTCGSRSSPVVVDEKQNYKGALNGVVDEQTGQMIQAAATVIGNISGMKTGLNTDEDYQTTLTFRCQNT